MKHKMIKKLGLVGAIFALTLSTTVISYAGTWEKQDNSWKYQEDSGSYAKSGWRKIDGTWYFFDAQGIMKTGWIKDQNVWYYLAQSGAMQTGWIKDQNTWYYLQGNGAMKTGWLKDQNTWYYLQGNGAMKTGWLKDGSKWYFLQGNGAMKTGWLKDKGKWYYLKDSGVMASNEWISTNGKTYYVDSNGVMATNTWIGNQYVNENGELVSTNGSGGNNGGNNDSNNGSGSTSSEDKTYTITLRNGQTKTVQGHFEEGMASEIVQMLNQYRQQNGVQTLTVDNDLKDYAGIRSYEITDTFDHTRPNGQGALTHQGANGENIAWGQTSASEVMTAWKNSPGHNQNMLRSSFKRIGISVFAMKNQYNRYTYYYVQIFGA